jgi:glycosyltransferase involved in cell wall biosynthesis
MLNVAFVVNGDPPSPMGCRARAFAEQLRGPFDIEVFYRSKRKVWSAVRFLAALLRSRPKVCYVFDMAYSGVVAALMYKRLTRARVVIDTGDAITELARSMGRSPLGIALTRRLEECSLSGADRIVVRGTYHKEWLAQRGVRAEVIQDGIESSLIGAPAADDLRDKLGLGGVLTVGLVGSLIWNRTLQSCYGLDLIELIRILKDRPVKGVIIGDGSGLPILQARCREYGIADRVLFLGRAPYEELPQRLGLIDVCLSTQTNDLPGQVRTTGKLPLYLAAGRYILASRVGEAARILDEDMLVDYDGNNDPDYPQKLAERVRRLLDNPELLGRGLKHVALAREKFDYAVLARKMAEVIDGVVAGR